MKLTRQIVIGSLDLPFGGMFVDAKKAVIIFASHIGEYSLNSMLGG